MFDDERADWDARKPKNQPTLVAPSRRTEFFNHYDGGVPIVVNTHADCLARVKHDQAFHMDSNGWSDIGYNGLVCQHGRAIEGRGIDYAGAHCPNHNTTGYGFQFMVGGTQAPTDAAKARMRSLYDDCTTRSGHALAKKGHRDGFATACPGEHIQAWVMAGMPSPTTPQPAALKEWFDMPIPDADLNKIADEVLKRPVADFYGETTTVGAAIGLTLRNSTRAAIDARVARTLAEAQAKAGKPLTADEIDDISASVVQALGKDYDANVTLTPKAGV